MPHCILEISDNILFNEEKPTLLLEINKCLSNTGLFNIEHIKSRIIFHKYYCIGNAEKNKAFVSMNISIFEGRKQSEKNMISEKCFELLKSKFKPQNNDINLNITVQISELNKESYKKINLNY